MRYRASSKHLLPIIGISLCLGVLILLGGLYFYKQKSSRSQPEKIPPTPNTAYTCLPLVPTPTLAPGQKAIYTFYIQATSQTTSRKGIGLKQTDTGKVFTVDIGTFIVVNFGRVGKFQVSIASPQDIFKCIGAECLPHSSPENSLYSSWVSHSGCGTISVTERT